MYQFGQLRSNSLVKSWADYLKKLPALFGGLTAGSTAFFWQVWSTDLRTGQHLWDGQLLETDLLLLYSGSRMLRIHVCTLLASENLADSTDRLANHKTASGRWHPSLYASNEDCKSVQAK